MTQGGPPRAHLFLIPAAAVILTEAGIRFCGRSKLRFGICAAILLLSQFSSWGQREWARPDFFAIAHELGELPEEVLWVVPANDTYPLSWNNRPHVMQDFLARLVVTPYSERSLLLVLLHPPKVTETMVSFHLQKCRADSIQAIQYDTPQA